TELLRRNKPLLSNREIALWVPVAPREKKKSVVPVHGVRADGCMPGCVLMALPRLAYDRRVHWTGSSPATGRHLLRHGLIPPRFVSRSFPFGPRARPPVPKNESTGITGARGR